MRYDYISFMTFVVAKSQETSPYGKTSSAYSAAISAIVSAGTELFETANIGNYSEQVGAEPRRL